MFFFKISQIPGFFLPKLANSRFPGKMATPLVGEKEKKN